jgi:hypothetical protein
MTLDEILRSRSHYQAHAKIHRAIGMSVEHRLYGMGIVHCSGKTGY